MKTLIIALVLGLVGPASAMAQRNTVIGAQLAIGYTAIDLPSALDWDSDYFDDWNQVFGAIRLQGTFARLGPARVGVEIAYSRLYYYYVTVPYVPSDLVYEEAVWVWSLAALAAFDMSEQFEVQAGIGLYGFESGAVAGLKGAALYRLPVAATLMLPIGVSVDVIFGDGTPIGLALALGLEYTLN